MILDLKEQKIEKNERKEKELDQLALVLLGPLAVPVDVETARPLLVERLHVGAAQLLALDVHLNISHI